MSNFEIRRVVESDTKRLSNLLGQLGYVTPPQKINTLLFSSSNSTSDVFVAIEEERVVAFISLIYFDYFPSAEKVCRITALVVDESLRGSGIGTQLIDYAKCEAIAKNCTVLEVTTSIKRDKTQAYYEGIGFEKTSYKYVQKLNFDIKE